ncbi:tyrosine-type recombinase/integrase [Pleurocapsa sp. FMAR1]|uniref:tyrosine-type recombinase/integrase n=1 Tax=Pleurocapsa sp. FMAR1 TaxID=3040204 RepID=UPI0029C650CE|nr:tyrosine-type recombinase/integrase [Pleurocapsa sp. FMAR1]
MRRNNPNNLIFPSVTGGYINQKTFSRRYWNTVTKGLIADGVLDKHYINYSLRHSFITRLVRSGEDIATIARISGNSTETIVNFYLSAKRDGFEIPEL